MQFRCKSTEWILQSCYILIKKSFLSIIFSEDLSNSVSQVSDLLTFLGVQGVARSTRRMSGCNGSRTIFRDKDYCLVLLKRGTKSDVNNIGVCVSVTPCTPCTSKWSLRNLNNNYIDLSVQRYKKIMNNHTDRRFF